MKFMFKKLFRDIGHSLGQFISIMIVIMVGSFFLSGMTESVASISRQIEDYNTQYNLCDGIANFTSIEEDTYRQINHKYGIEDYEGRMSLKAKLTFRTTDSDITILSSTTKINKAQLVSGRYPENNKNEILVDTSFYQYHKLKVGDILSPTDFTIGIMDLDYPIIEGFEGFTVVGEFNSPEFIMKIADTSVTTSDKGGIGIFITSMDTIKSLGTDPQYTDKPAPVDPSDPPIVPPPPVDPDAEPKPIFVNEILLKTNGEIDPNNALSNVDGHLVSTTDSTNYAQVAFKMTMDQIDTLCKVFPLVFFLVAVVLIYIYMTKTVETQRSQIGIMKALGVKNNFIYASFILNGLIASISGSLIGGTLGLLVLPPIFKWVFSVQFILPSTALHLQYWFLLVSVLIASFFATLTTYFSIRRTLAEVPAQTLRPKAPKKSKPILLEKTALWNKMSFGAKIISRNMFLGKRRLLLSTIGIIGCVALVLTGVGLKDRINYTIKQFEKTIAYDVSITTREPITRDSKIVEDSIGADNISKLEYSSYGNSVTLLKNPTNAGSMSVGFFTYAIEEEDSRLTHYYSDKDGSIIPIKHNTVIVRKTYADANDLKIGDNLKMLTTLTDEDGKEEPYIISLLISHIGNQYMAKDVATSYSNYDFECEDGVPLSSIIGPGTSLPGITLPIPPNYIEARFTPKLKNIAVELTPGYNAYHANELLLQDSNVHKSTVAEDHQKQLSQMMVMLDVIVMIIICGAAVLAITVIYNITSINIKERMRELATLRVLGYRIGETLKVIFIENFVMTLLGCLLGLPIGYILFRFVISIVSTMVIAITPTLAISVILIAFSATFVFSILANLMQIKSVKSINMTEALKGVE